MARNVWKGKTRRRGARGFLSAFFALFVLAVLASPWIYWRLEPPHYVHAVILDKTVPTRNYREHKGLMWVLNNLKFFDRDTGSAFRYDRDYYGFFPLDDRSFDVTEMPADLASADLIYLADTYGVYSDDFYVDEPREGGSGLVYGGITAAEVGRLKQALSPASVLIAEFNSFGAPTGTDAREELQQLLGVKWMGWTGRYFADLGEDNDEIPVWLVENYEAEYGREWEFSGPGLALVSADGSVIILRQGEEIGFGLNRVTFTEPAQKEFGVKNDVCYYYWFDVVTPGEGTQVLASFNLDLTPAGRKMLAGSGLNGSFPAVLRNQALGTRYYFAGDFADTDDVPPQWDSAAYGPLHRWLSFSGSDRQAFFWDAYYPVLKKILGGVGGA